MSVQALAPYSELSLVLDSLASKGEIVDFWLRDDDAVAPSESLSTLLALCERHAAPVTLAIIPEHTGSALVHELKPFPQVSVAVHGWSHINHAPQGEKKRELGNDRPIEHICAELRRALDKLSRLHGSRFVPVLVPPWNRISESLLEHLQQLGYTAVSTFGQEGSAGIAMINTQVDVIYCKGGNGVREASELVAEIIAQLYEGRTTIGILTHHLVHVPESWDFLENLIALLNRHPAARWVSITDLVNKRLARP